MLRSEADLRVRQGEATVRAAFIVSFAANVILALISLVILPPRIAIHFGPGGMPDNWAPNHANSLIFLGLHTVLFFSLYFSPRLTLAFPAKWINLPNRAFWLGPEHRGQTAAKISALMHQFGVAVFLFLFATGLLTIQANLAEPVRLNEVLAFTFLFLFLIYCVLWCIGFFRSFRLPKEINRANHDSRARRT